MAFTKTDLDSIEDAIASGALRVRFADGREVYYQTSAEMLRVRAAIAASLLDSQPTPTPRMTRVVVNRGFGSAT